MKNEALKAALKEYRMLHSNTYCVTRYRDEQGEDHKVSLSLKQTISIALDYIQTLESELVELEYVRRIIKLASQTE